MNVLSLPPLSGTASAIANHLWQSTVFAGVVWLLALLLRNNQARIRHALWFAASLKFLLPFSLLITLGSLLPQPRSAAAAAPQPLYSAVDFATQPFAAWEPAPAADRAPTTAQLIAVHLPYILLALWIAGTLAVLLTWFLRWHRLNKTLRFAIPAHTGREYDLLRRVEATLPARSPLPLRLSSDLIEPGLFRIARPVLVWPQRLTPLLEDEHIEAILTHELMHARRCDNLTAALHMLVEAVLWFHPLVWWIGRRLLDERERACDEAVVQLGGRPDTYAESLLKACRFCIESPLPCVSGITGADLAERVRSIMTAALAAKLTLSRKLLLITAAILGIAAPLAIGEIAAISNSAVMARFLQVRPPLPPPPPPPPPGWKASDQKHQEKIDSAQAVPSAVPSLGFDGKPLAFDVVTIKPSKTFHGGMGLSKSSKDSISIVNVSPRALVANAYGLKPRLVLGGPDWLDSTEYDIEAKLLVPDGGHPPQLTFDQIKLMIQALLAGRFRLAVHSETRQLPVYDLVIAKGGSKLHEAMPGDTYANGLKGPDGRSGAGMMMLNADKFTGQAIAISGLVDTLSIFLDRTVIDRTGLSARYDIALQLPPHRGLAPQPPSSEPAATNPDDSAPSIFTIVEQELGLKLNSTKGPVKVLVIDHIEPPSAN